MMVVISLTDCPPKVRGDLTKWLCEISTGVYVGKISARVRDELWERICDSVRSGRVTMVFTTNNEQGYDFRVHNTSWLPVDFDGLKLMLHPTKSDSEKATGLDYGFSKASKRRTVQRMTNARIHKSKSEFVVIDVETSGLQAESDVILELGALRIIDGEIADSWSSLIRTEAEISDEITRLTGLTKELCNDEGADLETTLTQFIAFVGDCRVVCHNAPFDYSFIRKACEKLGLQTFANRCEDTLRLSRQRLPQLNDHKLTTVAAHFGEDIAGAHRALKDCILTFAVYEKLNKI